MNNEHNPIAQLITKIQQKWIENISPYDNIQLVRWLIKTDETRLYEGFLRLESTTDGSIPEVPVVLLNGFENIESHSKTLIKSWIESLKNDETIQQGIANNTLEFNWPIADYEKQLESTTDANVLLLDMLETFQKAMPNSQLHLTLALYPYTVSSPTEYGKWIEKIMTLGVPENVRLMIFDYTDERYFEWLIKKFEVKSKSLAVLLDLDSAINKIATSGNPNDPEVQFRTCMAEMSKSVANKNKSRLQHWGQKGLEITQKTGNKSAFATAHMVYVGMLFNFKDYKVIDDLLLKSLAIAKQGLKVGDKTCAPIIIQNYGFQASSKLLQKQKEEAANLYSKQAVFAVQNEFKTQALSAWWSAYNAIRKRNKSRYNDLLTKAYQFGSSLPIEELKSSVMRYIAWDYYNLCDYNNETKKCDAIHEFMTQVENNNWKHQVEEQQKEIKKNSNPLLNWI